MVLFNKCSKPWTLVLKGILSDLITRHNIFLKFSAPPFVPSELL
jgi:hypothetical protein